MKCLPLLGDKIDDKTAVDGIAFGLRLEFDKIKNSESNIDINQALKDTNEYKLYGKPVTIEYVDDKYVSKGNIDGKDVNIDMSMKEDGGNDAFFFAKKYMELSDEQKENLTIEAIKEWWNPGKINLDNQQVLAIIKTASGSKNDVNEDNFQNVLKGESVNITKESKKDYDTYWWAMTPEEKDTCLDREGIYGVAPNGQKITMREALEKGLLKKIEGGPYHGLPISWDTNGDYIFKGSSMARGQGRKYGSNTAADNLIITYDINTGQPLILSLTRKREKCDSMPGGMRDGKELNILTAIRETIEELELSVEKDVKEYIKDALKQYKVDDSKITDAIYKYCTDIEYRVGGDMSASANYGKFEKKNKVIIEAIAKIKGFAIGMNYDQRDGMLTDHGTEVFPMILPPKFIKKLQKKLIKANSKESTGYSLRPLEGYKDLPFANHATLIAQTIVPFAKMEYERIFKKCFPGDYNIKFDGENIIFVANKKSTNKPIGLTDKTIKNIFNLGKNKDTKINYKDLFGKTEFQKLYSAQKLDNTSKNNEITEKMELFSVDKDTSTITINDKIKIIYEPTKINQQIPDNNPNQTKQFLRAQSALRLETRKESAQQITTIKQLTAYLQVTQKNNIIKVFTGLSQENKLQIIEDIESKTEHKDKIKILDDMVKKSRNKRYEGGQFL